MPTNPLMNLLPEKVRASLYAALTLGALVFGIWQASEGDWKVFVGSVLAALISLMATANVGATSPPTHPEQDHLPFDERGFVDGNGLIGLVVVIVLLLIILRVFGLV